MNTKKVTRKQIEAKAQEYMKEIPAIRQIRQVVVCGKRGGYYLNVAYHAEAANYSLGETLDEAVTRLQEWRDLEIAFA